MAYASVASSDLRGDLAAMESRGQSSDESVQKIALITKQAVDAQNKTDYLHGALKEAKEVGALRVAMRNVPS